MAKERKRTPVDEKKKNGDGRNKNPGTMMNPDEITVSERNLKTNATS